MFEKSREHRIAVKHALNGIEKYMENTAYSFALDTNVLIVLAENNEKDLLVRLVKCPGFMAVEITRTEIKYKIKDGELSLHAIKNLKKFVDAFVEAKRKFRRINTRQIEKELMPLTALLPRKLVDEVIFKFNDSALNNLLSAMQEKLEQGKTMADLGDEIRTYHQEKKDLKDTIKDRFLELCNSLGVDDFRINQRRYFNNVDKAKRRRLIDINDVFDKKRNLNMTILMLKQLGTKGYRADVKFVAMVIKNGAEGISFDQDVITLFELHASRKVA